MRTVFDIVTFDCYGTLVDWEGGISGAFAEAAAAAGVVVDRANVIAAHAEVEPQVQAAAYRSYREVLRETAVGIAKKLGWNLPEEHASFLADSLADWAPFPDTSAALQRLRAAGYRLGILSNIDDDLLEGTLRGIEVDFDLVVTAEQVRSYKPAHRHFDEARCRLGDLRWLHAAQSFFHDVVPARELSIPVAWINRKREQPSADARPDAEFADLTGLAEWLA